MQEDLVKAFYHDILNRVLAIERRRKQIAEQILLVRTTREKLPLIRDFLNCNLDKNRLLEQAAIAATQNMVDEVLEHIGRLYGGVSIDAVIDTIREEIERNQSLLNPVVKEIKHPRTTNFLERRMIKEIEKAVMKQAREYAKIEF